MPLIIADPPPFLTIVILLGTLVTGLICWRNRSRKSKVALAIAAVIAGAFFVISWRWESPREQAYRRVQGVIDAMNRYDTGAAMTHVSDRFDYRGARKQDLRQAPLNAILRERRANIQAWGFSRDTTEYEADRCTISFSVNVSGDLGSRIGFFVKATVAKDADGEYRMIGFRVFENTLQGSNSPEFVVPGLAR
jgi:hypothetical protein